MQEDFPCLAIGQGPYEMQIENNNFIKPSKENGNPKYLNSFRQNLKEGEMPHDKKAIIYLDNSIKLSLQIKMFKEDAQSQLAHSTNGSQNLRRFQQNEIPKYDQDKISLSSKFLHENNKITSIISIQTQNETINIANEMFLTNQLEKNTQGFINQQLSDKVLTKQYLLNLPDDSGKRDINYDIHSMRKISDNSNNSDTTQPCISNTNQNNPYYFTYRCFGCGKDNTISIDDSIKNPPKLLTNPCLDKQYDKISFLQSKTIESQDNYGILQEKIKKQNYFQDQTVNEQQIDATKRQKKQIEMKMQQNINQHNQIISKSIPNISKCKKNVIIELSPQKKIIKSKQRNTKYLPSQKQVNQEQNSDAYKNVSIVSLQSFDNSNKEEIDSGIQLKDESFLCVKNLISTVQQEQSEQPYNSSFNQSNQSEINKVNYETKESLQILSQIQTNNNLSILKDNESSLNIQNQEKNNKSYSHINNTNLNIHNNQALSINIYSKINNPNCKNISNIKNNPLIYNSSDISRKQQQLTLHNNIQSCQINQKGSFIQNLNESVNKNFKQNDFIQAEKIESDENYQEDDKKSSCEQDDIDMNFTDDNLAKKEKKNVVKNFVKAFISFVKKNKYLLNEVPTKSVKTVSQPQKLKNFITYMMKKNKFNNNFIKQLINNCDYSPIFQSFLLNNADDWLKNSNVQDKETHKEMLIFFQRSIIDSKELEKLRVLKKSKRIPYLISNKIQSTPSTTSSKGVIQTNQRIESFSQSPFKGLDQTDDNQLGQKQINKIEISSQRTFEDINSSQDISNQQIELQNNKQLTITPFNQIQQILNNIQINSSIESQNLQNKS